MNVQALTPILNVSSLEESFRWFEKLGWRKLWHWGDPPTFGAVGSGRTEIFLCESCQGSRDSPADREPWDDQTGSTWMSWWLATPADVDAAYARALELGIAAPFPPTDMPWSVRECHIRHPDGHTIRVGAGRGEDEEPE
jgi:hypothetical protein